MVEVFSLQVGWVFRQVEWDLLVYQVECDLPVWRGPLLSRVESRLMVKG